MLLPEKRIFKILFIITALTLLALPAVTTFNEFLTRIVMSIGFYRGIQDLVVPIEAKMITVVLHIFGVSAFPNFYGVNIGKAQAIGSNVIISWNCIGWQSFLLFSLTLFTGLQGPYTLTSKLQAMTIGFLGTFFMNLTRISLVVLLIQFIGKTAGLIFHDYFSTVVTILWLFFFWWFAFKFILERKDEYPRAIKLV